MPSDALFPGSVLSMTAQAADRLLASRNPDGALLYLYLLRQNGSYEAAGAGKALGWDSQRLDAAFAALLKLGLAGECQRSAAPAPAPLPDPDEPPQYTRGDLIEVLEDQKSSFPPLLAEVERLLGKKLGFRDTTTLLDLYDHLALPAEVILLLVNWCIEESRRKYGEGRMPFLSTIKKEGYAWHRKGIDTAEAAELLLKHLSQLRTRTREVLLVLDIRGRPPITEEEKFIAGWLDMGFGDDAIRLAYEKTVLKTQGLSWTYLNSILRDWHKKGLHTLAEIREKDSAYTQSKAAGRAAPQRTDPGPDDAEWMERFLARQKAEDAGREGT